MVSFQADCSDRWRRAGTLCMGCGRARFCQPKRACAGLWPVWGQAGTFSRGRRALTRNIPRISYRIQAFFWNPGGGSTSFAVRPLKLGCQVHVPSEGRVEQEADGSWVTIRQAGAELESSGRTCGNRVLHLSVRPEPGPGELNGPGQAKSIPGDKFFQAAGSKPGLPVPERTRLFAAGAVKG